jgi:hypothetical protein
MEFKGLWIRVEVLRDARLSHFEKLLLAEVEVYAASGGAFWKSNAQVMADYGVSLSVVKRAVKTLCECGYVSTDMVKGRTRQILISTTSEPSSKMTRREVQKRPGRGVKNDPTGGSKVTRQEVQKRPTKRIREKKEGNNEVIYPCPFDVDEFKEVWAAWKEYKRAEHRFTFKTAKTENHSLKQLHQDSNGNLETATEAIKRSIASGYKGLFPNPARSSGRDNPIDKTRTLEWLDR